MKVDVPFHRCFGVILSLRAQRLGRTVRRGINWCAIRV